MTKPLISGVLRISTRDIENAETELERLLALSVREKNIEAGDHGGFVSNGAKFERSTDIPSDFLLRELHCELSIAVSR